MIISIDSYVDTIKKAETSIPGCFGFFDYIIMLQGKELKRNRKFGSKNL